MVDFNLFPGQWWSLTVPLFRARIWYVRHIGGGAKLGPLNRLFLEIREFMMFILVYLGSRKLCMTCLWHAINTTVPLLYKVPGSQNGSWMLLRFTLSQAAGLAYLVAGWAYPLKNMSQLAWWKHRWTKYDKITLMFQTTNWHMCLPY